MTTDAFTEQARAEAERRLPGDYWGEHGMHDFGAAMAEWARDHLAAQEPTDAEIGALQKCLYDRTLTWVPTGEARRALTAAKEARR